MNTLFPGVKFARVKGNIQSAKFLLRPSADVSTDMTKQQEENKLNKKMDADIMISKVQLSRMSIFMYWNDLNVVKSKTYALNKQ